MRNHTSTIHIIFFAFILFLSACEQRTVQGEENIDNFNLNTLNLQNWDLPSKEIIQKSIKTPFDQLNYLQKKQLAETLITHKQYKIAILLLENMDYLKSQYLTFLLATANFEKGDLPATLKILGNNPTTSTSINHLLYKALLENGEPKKIISSYEDGKNTKQFDQSLAKYYLAIAYLQNNNCHKSIKLLSEVLKLQSHANKLYIPLAKAYQKCQMPNQAQQARTKSGKKPLLNSDTFTLRLMKNGNPIKYTKQLLNKATIDDDDLNITKLSEQLIEYQAQTPQILNNYAIILIKSGQLTKANKTLLQATKMESNNLKANLLLYKINKRNNFTNALLAIDKLIEQDSLNPLYIQSKADLYYLHEKYTLANYWYQKLISIQPSNLSGYTKSMLKLEKSQELIAHLKQQLKIQNNYQKHISNLLARVLMINKNSNAPEYQQALSIIEKQVNEESTFTMKFTLLMARILNDKNNTDNLYNELFSFKQLNFQIKQQLKVMQNEKALPNQMNEDWIW